MEDKDKSDLLQPFFKKGSWGDLGERTRKVALAIGGAAALFVGTAGALQAEEAFSLDLNQKSGPSVESVDPGADQTRAKLKGIMGAMKALTAGDAGVNAEAKPDGSKPFEELFDKAQESGKLRSTNTGNSVRDQLNVIRNAVGFIAAGNDAEPAMSPDLIGSAGGSGNLMDRVTDVQIVSAGPAVSESLDGKPTLDMLHDLQVQAAQANDYQNVEKFVEARDVFQELLDKAADGSDTVYDQSKLRRISRITKEMHEEAFGTAQPDPTDQVRDFDDEPSAQAPSLK